MTALDPLRELPPLLDPALTDQARRGRLYAILDACDQPLVPEKVWELGEERAVSLYRDEAELEFWDIAPYLVRVDLELLDWVYEHLWREPWGIFVTSGAGLPVLRTHFRHFLLVKDPDGDEMYFRFYDPRVLPAYLDSCTAEERGVFFGPVEAFAAENPRTGHVQHLAREGRA
ncbi:MAG: hypothetical protein K0Q72_2568 [Armatimonadetes bacterium]|nr:hypothetical protein [Armatimonadota bacterium]